MNKLSIFVFLVAVAGMMNGCNTVHGLGQDMEGAGKTIQNTF